MHNAATLDQILTELQATASLIQQKEADQLVDGILKAKKVFVAGAGRSGFMAKSFAMRLRHIGFDPYVVGETVAPTLEADDIFIVGSGSGETKSPVAMVESEPLLFRLSPSFLTLQSAS